MNPIVKQQLEKCRVANIPPFDDDTKEIVINKGNKFIASEYQVHKCYFVELEDYIINPPPDFTLAVNWNKGTVPPSKYMKVEIAQVMGKMIRIIGTGYDMINHVDMNVIWEGWVPGTSMKLLQKLD